MYGGNTLRTCWQHNVVNPYESIYILFYSQVNLVKFILIGYSNYTEFINESRIIYSKCFESRATRYV